MALCESDGRLSRQPIVSQDDSNAAICRICYGTADDDDDEEFDEGAASNESSRQLVSLCNCTGSIAFTHTACLNRWLQRSQATACELCGVPYPLTNRDQRFSFRTTSLLLLLYTGHLLRKSPVELFLDIVYTLLLFAPSTAFLVLHMNFINLTDKLRLNFDLVAVLCGLLLIGMTSATWLVTMLLSHQDAFLNWKSRQFKYGLLDIGDKTDLPGTVAVDLAAG